MHSCKVVYVYITVYMLRFKVLALTANKVLNATTSHRTKLTQHRPSAIVLYNISNSLVIVCVQHTTQ